MEINPLPFLNQDDYSHFYNNFLSEMDSNNAAGASAGFSFSLNNSNDRKRHRKDEDDYNNNNNGNGFEDAKNNTSALKDIFTSLILLDEEDEEEGRKKVMESNFNHTNDDYYNYSHQFQQDHYAETPDFQHPRTNKKPRHSSVSTSSVSPVSDNVGPEIPPPATHRRLWVKDRSKDWWERCNHPDFPEDEFRRAFRMSKSTFDMICTELESAVTKKNTMLRDAIPVRQRVAVCIWRLATGDPLRLVSKRFGLGISTCHKLVLEVCSAIKTVLMPKFLHWPEEQSLNTIKQEFESISGIPNIGGSMYTTHIPIIAPKISVSAYFNKRHTERNQKTSYSITVQGVVDPNGVFTDVCIGWPGSMPDDQVLEKSALFQRASKGLLRDVWIVGNKGYPLMDWVLVPYNHQNLTWTQHAFNEKVGEVGKVGKEAFGRLKGRWACLQKRTEVKLQDLPVVLGACCVLHNICEMRKEGMEEEWGFEVFDDEMVAENGVRSGNAVQKRDFIAHNLLHHGLAGTGFL